MLLLVNQIKGWLVKKEAQLSSRLSSLDSIRGLAALMVVFFHFASAFFPRSVGEVGTPIHTRIDTLVYQSPLSSFIAGSFGVTLFFVLSGFVLTFRFYSGRQKTLFPSAAKRYFRLMPVAFASVMFGYFLMAFGLMHFREAGQLSGSHWLGQMFFTFHPHLLDAITQGLIGIFIEPSSNPIFKPFNPVLWTIYYELIGSLLIFGLASVCNNNKKRWLIYLISVIGFIGTYFSAFIIGAILADLYATSKNFTKRLSNMRPIYKILALAFVILTAGYVGGRALSPRLDPIGSYWEGLTLLQGYAFISRNIIQLIDAFIIISLALYSARIIKLLNNRVLVFLGHISYSVYALHFLIIFSFSSWLFSNLSQHYTYIESFLFTFSISLPIILIASYLLTKYVEAPSLELANRVEEWTKK